MKSFAESAEKTLGVVLPEDYVKFMKRHNEKLSDNPVSEESWIPGLGSLNFMVGTTLAFRSTLPNLDHVKVVIGYSGTRLVEKINEEIDVYFVMDTRDGRIFSIDSLGMIKPLADDFEKWVAPRLFKAELRDKYRSHLVVIGFDDEHQADKLRSSMLRMKQDGWLELEDAAVAVKKADGRVVFSEVEADETSSGEKPGFLARLLQTLLIDPVVGHKSRGGEMSKALSYIGLDDPFIQDLARTLKPGSSALFLLCQRARPGKVQAILDELLRFKGKLLVTSLSPQKEAILQQAVETIKEEDK